MIYAPTTPDPMLERARQVLELTHYAWQLNERTQRRRRKASKAHAHYVPLGRPTYGRAQGQSTRAFT